jgi:ribosomal protein S18 acetylase RimI-like enzyme
MIEQHSISLTRMNSDEFKEYSNFSFENYIIETSKSSGIDIQTLKPKVGGPPKEVRDNDLWLLIKEQNENIGFLWIEIKEDGEAFGWDIFLNESHRSKGIGRHVMLEAGKILNKYNVDRIRFCVIESNTVARALYSSLGFKEINFNETHRRYTLELSLTT